MPSPASFLENPARFAAAPSPETAEVDSDAVVILSVLLCCLISVVGVGFLARCAWLRRSAGSLWQHPPPDKGLKKRALMLLPKLPFDGAVAAGGRVAECPICLSEFREGEEIRLLPQCGHGFHVVCVDTWLGSHSNCPSCRRVLVVPPPPPSRCRQSGGSSGGGGGGADVAADLERGEKAEEDGGANGLLT